MSSRHRSGSRGGLFLVSGNVDRGQCASAIKHGELARTATIRRDAVAGPTANERGRDHVARNLSRRPEALQLKAARAGLVAAADRLTGFESATWLSTWPSAPDARRCLPASI